MNLIKVGAAVINQTPLDWYGNKARLLGAINEAKAEGVQLLCLPEMCITGYGCEDHFHSRAVQQEAIDILMDLTGTEGIAFCVGLPILHKNALFNCTALLANGRILGLVAKQHLAGDGIHYEPRWFKPWPKGVQETITLPDLYNEVPIGDVTFELSNIHVGFEICEDAWVADRPGTELAKRGVDVILNPSASHFAFGKSKTRERFVIEGSRAFGCTYIYTNLLGNEAGRAIYDGGAIIATCGQIVAQGKRLSFKDSLLTMAVIDVDATRTIQSRTASFSPSLGRLTGKVPRARLPGNTPSQPEPATQGQRQDLEWEVAFNVKEEEFTRAMALALFDYLRKSKSRGFVLSLSGGADSAACAILVYAMVHLAAEELKTYDETENARDVVLQRLFGVNHKLPKEGDLKSLVNDLLTCVYQKACNSSETTETAAREVATEIGAQFVSIDVDNLVKGYTKLAEQALGRPLDWDHDDLALQNIQARVRSPSIWMIANVKNALLLATSNRSEAAVGYTTMDGDTSGSISPVAGIDKDFLRRWLEWAGKPSARAARLLNPPRPFPYVAALTLVTRQAPTAELRPAAAAQTDEKDLMPYDVLDAIEKAAIRDKQSPVEVYKIVRAAFPRPHWSSSLVAEWVTKFFRLWARNQWKRERLALSFHIDDEDLDPRAWCRFPVLSGGFQKELEELERHAAQDKDAI